MNSDLKLIQRENAYVFLNNQVLHAFHDKIWALGHKFRKHVYCSSSTSRVLARASRNLAARPKMKIADFSNMTNNPISTREITHFQRFK